MAIGLFGIANQVGHMPGILPKPPSGVVHVEAFCNVAGASATVQLQGALSGHHWHNVGNPIVCVGTAPQLLVINGVNFAQYKAKVTAFNGPDNSNVRAYMGD